ncbi:hypothetical protein ACLHDG_08310 [Sulfurovum sp. CS9]|uniref:hypothetical protein n=1 Tax=Sulfurovum sp. CS9 TaxID=3391146 RepID=UPI0039EB1138
MKVILNILIFIAIVVFLLFLLFSDTQKNTYKNKKEVIKDNAIQRGWIPEILPDSAFQIIETHNLDTNSINGSFQYSEKDEDIFINKLQNINGILIWKDFQFIIDKTNNRIEFKNK